MAKSLPGPHADLLEYAKKLEDHYLDMQDLEFTVEGNKLYMLQTRRGKRTGRAAVRIAVDMVREGMIDKEEAVRRVEPDQLEQLLHPVVDASADAQVLTTGLNASPGAASGMVVFEADEAERLVEEGHKVILVRHETSPDDFHGMAVASAIVTSRGGVTSHAAVVARGMGKCCVVGCESLEVDYSKHLARAGDTILHVGDWITVDGNHGEVLMGEVPTIEPEFDEQLETLMGWADEIRTLGVRTNADTPEDAEVAVRFGAEGIGLCRTEHMFFAADRIEAMRRRIMAPTRAARVDAPEELEPMQVEDFTGIFRAMDGKPVTIRLLDPPLHEFLPHHSEILEKLTDLKLKLKEAANLEEMDELIDEISAADRILEQVERLGEANPMLGHRGCRLGNTYPEVTEMQARAIFEAAVACSEEGIEVHPEIMIPLVGFVTELERQEEIVRTVADEVLMLAGVEIDYKVGTMIELPRAALTAGEIARSAEFFSFGTNDLTQTTLGMSRDDSAKFLSTYVKNGIVPGDPFQSIDRSGVGELVKIGVERGKAARPDIHVGICGEHGGDPASIEFVAQLGLDYVSCSPYRVPIARLAAAHAALD
jgi:pyruvate,orthophosphate dikinase